MKKIFSTIFLLTILTIFSSGQNTMIYEGKIAGRKYTSKIIGWTIKIPKNWDTNSPANLGKDQKKAHNLVKKVSGNNIDTCGLYLTGFQRNTRNVFLATAQPYKAENVGTINEYYKFYHKLMYDVCIQKNVKFDTASTSETIDNLSFDVFKLTTYYKNGAINIHSDTYSGLINGYIFGAIITYDNEADKKTMMDAWRKSKFKK